MMRYRRGTRKRRNRKKNKYSQRYGLGLERVRGLFYERTGRSAGSGLVMNQNRGIHQLQRATRRLSSGAINVVLGIGTAGSGAMTGNAAPGLSQAVGVLGNCRGRCRTGRQQ